MAIRDGIRPDLLSIPRTLMQANAVVRQRLCNASATSLVGAGSSIPHDLTVDEGAGQLIPVNHGVVPAAEQGVVGEVGGSVVDPVPQVVCVAPLCGDVAAREGAVPIPKPEGFQLSWGEPSFGTALVQDFAVAAPDGGDDRRVAGQPPDCFGPISSPPAIDPTTVPASVAVRSSSSVMVMNSCVFVAPGRRRRSTICGRVRVPVTRCSSYTRCGTS